MAVSCRSIKTQKPVFTGFAISCLGGKFRARCGNSTVSVDYWSSVVALVWNEIQNDETQRHSEHTMNCSDSDAQAEAA